MGDIIAIADICDLPSFYRAEMFPEREEVRERLAWMFPIRQCIDHGDAAACRQVGYSAVGGGTCGDDLHPAREIASHVLDGFPHAKADIVRSEVDCMAA